MIHTYINVSTDQVNNDLEKILNWAHQWKMTLNPGILLSQLRSYLFKGKGERCPSISHFQ